MRSSAFWLQVAGYFFLLGAIAYGLFQLFFPPDPPPEAAPEPVAEPVTLEDWITRADESGGHAPGHARCVAERSLALAAACGLREIDTRSLELAALLSGVGFIGWRPDLLAKPGPLSPAERLQLEGRAAAAAERALEITGDAACAQWLRWSHERFDGLGYPDGLSEALIPLPSRILHLALSLEAMKRPRPYREALGAEQIKEEIGALAGLVYDPEVVRLYLASPSDEASAS